MGLHGHLVRLNSVGMLLLLLMLMLCMRVLLMWLMWVCDVI